MKKMAILTVTGQIIREMLQLPDGCEIIRVEVQQGYREVFRLVIDGAGWDTPEGAAIQQALVATVDAKGIHWGLPE